MSAFTLRWCKEHGDWDDDVDNPSEACPTCIESGAFKTRAQLERELAEARAQIEAGSILPSLPTGTVNALKDWVADEWKIANAELTERAERAEAIAKGWAEAADRARQPDVFYKDYNEGTMRAMQALLSKASVKLTECMAHAEAMESAPNQELLNVDREAFRTWRAKQ